MLYLRLKLHESRLIHMVCGDFIINYTMSIRPPFDPQSPQDVKTAFSREMDFWDDFKPIYYFSRAFGLLPFSIRRNPNGDIQEPNVNKFDGFWFLFTIAVLLSGSYFAHQYIFAFNSNARIYLSIVLDDSHVVLSLIFGALQIAMDMFNRFEVVKLWQCFIIFDREVGVLHKFLENKLQVVRLFDKFAGVSNGH